MSKMFVHYKGTVEAFKAANLETTYTNHIVFIKGGADGKGAAIYTHGNYYADLNEATKALNTSLANLKYISSVKAGGVTATASGPEGVIEFAAVDPTTVEVTAGATGVNIGLTAEFKKQVADNTTAIATETEARGTAINLAKQELTATINAKADTSVVEGVAGRVATIEADYLKAADIAGKLDASVYTEKVAALEKADTDNLAAAKAYVDAEILKLDAAAQASQVEANRLAIVDLVAADGAMDERVKVLEAIDHAQLATDASAAAVATVLDGAPEKFDTLKEIAQWIADSETATEAADLVTRVATLEAIDHEAYKAADTTLETALKSYADQAEADAVSAAATDATTKADTAREAAKTYADGLNTAMDTRVATLEGHDVYVADDVTSAIATAKSEAITQAQTNTTTALEGYYTKAEVDAMWAWEEFE